MKMIGLSSIRQFLSFYRLPILSGILIGTSYIPSYPLAVFWSFVPLWIFFLKNFQPRQAFIAGWITQFILTLIGFHWVAYTAHEFGHLPWALSILVLIGFCSISNLHIPLAGWLWAHINKRWSPSKSKSLLVLACLTVLGEIYFPMIFPWHHGYVWLWAGWEGYHFADVIGMQALSAISIFSNIIFYLLWKKVRQKEFKKAFIGLIGFIVLFIAFNQLGHIHGKKWNQTDTQKNILAVQANIGNLMKHIAQQGSLKATQNISEKFFRLTEAALKKHQNTDYIIWPETAYPEYLNPPFLRHRYNVKLRQKVQSWQIPLITGGYRFEFKDKSTFNSLYFLNKEDGSINHPPYSKSILLAFGEYFPGAEYFPFLYDLVPAISNFGRGEGPTSIDFYGTRFGPQICYEGLYPEFSRKTALQGAELLINVTNDSWFGRYFEPYQHLYMTFGRAIEVRRPLIRSTNTGITTAILANGQILEMSPIKEEWAGQFQMKYKKNPPQTLFARYGNYDRYFFIGLFFLILLLIWSERKKTELH